MGENHCLRYQKAHGLVGKECGEDRALKDKSQEQTKRLRGPQVVDKVGKGGQAKGWWGCWRCGEAFQAEGTVVESVGRAEVMWI